MQIPNCVFNFLAPLRQFVLGPFSLYDFVVGYLALMGLYAVYPAAARTIRPGNMLLAALPASVLVNHFLGQGSTLSRKAMSGDLCTLAVLGGLGWATMNMRL